MNIKVLCDSMCDIPEEIKAVIETIEYQDEETEYFHSDNWESALDIYEKLISNNREEEE